MSNIDSKALYALGYGLYVLTTFDGEKHNGMIVNTVMQLTSTPCRVAVCINKENYSCGTVSKTGKMNVCCLTTETPFSVFQNFGFQSGKDVNKFADLSPSFSENGLAIVPEYTGAFLSLSVEEEKDMGSHILFLCSVTESRVLLEKEYMTYAFYHKNVKPKPEAKKKKAYVCKICGYQYEGETLPEDFVCPWCKHGAEDFELLSF